MNPLGLLPDAPFFSKKDACTDAVYNENTSNHRNTFVIWRFDHLNAQPLVDLALNVDFKRFFRLLDNFRGDVTHAGTLRRSVNFNSNYSGRN